MAAETKKIPKEEGFYAMREIGASSYLPYIAEVYREEGILMVNYLGLDLPTLKLKDCAKRWWFKLPSHNLGK